MRTSSDFWARVVATYKVLTTLTFEECSQVRQIETKRRNQSVSGDDAGLIYPNIVLGLWPVIFGNPEVAQFPTTVVKRS